MRTARPSSLAGVAALVAVLVAACESPNPYTPTGEPLYRGRPAVYWISQLRYDLPRGYDEDVIPAIAHLAPVDEQAAGVLDALLRDRDPAVRIQAVTALASVDAEQGERQAGVLLAMLDDPDAGVAGAALKSLVAIDARRGGLAELRTVLPELTPRADMEWSRVLDHAALAVVGPAAVGAGSPELGLALAETSVRLAPKVRAAYLDTLAWAHFRAGDVERSVALAREAVAAGTAESAAERTRYDESLRHFLGE